MITKFKLFENNSEIESIIDDDDFFETHTNPIILNKVKKILNDNPDEINNVDPFVLNELISHRKWEMFKLLVDYKINLNTNNYPLAVAIDNYFDNDDKIYLKMFYYLIKNDADINLRYNETLLTHYSKYDDNFNKIIFLVNNGADLNIKNVDGFDFIYLIDNNKHLSLEEFIRKYPEIYEKYLKGKQIKRFKI